MANLTILEAFNQSLSATKKYVDNRINGLASETYVNNAIAGFASKADPSFTGNVTVAGKVTVSTAPTADMDVATKKYVDDKVAKVNASGGYTHPDTHPASMITGLATVATSGSYNDLTNKPTIPDVSDKANISGQVFTGAIEAPTVIASTYFRTPALVGEGDNSTYYHRVNFGYQKHDYWEFHEYGGDYRFYENKNGTAAGGTMIANIKSTYSDFKGEVRENGTRVYSPNNKPTAADLGITIPSIDGLATETYVNNKVAGLIDSAPEALNTLNKLASALGDDANFSTTVSNQIGSKVDKVEGKSLVLNTEIAKIHEHGNKDLLDTIEADNVHAHSNKSVIDAITSDMTTKWNKSIPFENSYVSDCNAWLTNGYTKTSTDTTNHPSVCTDSDRWGVLFFIAEDEQNRTGTQMYFPIDGTYAGRIFTRRILQGTPGDWDLVPTLAEMTEAINNASLGGANNINVDNCNFFTKFYNVYDNKSTNDLGLNNSGTMYPASGRYTSDYIELKKYVYADKIGFVCWYDVNKSFIYADASAKVAKKLDIPENAKYFRYEVWSADISTASVYNVDEELPEFPPKTKLNNTYLDINFINNAIKNKYTTTIACYGDSLTEGAGSTNAGVYSYPTRLESLINEHSINYSVSVYNRGIGGNTSEAIIAKSGCYADMVEPFTIPADTTPVAITKNGLLANNVGGTISIRNGVNPVTIGGIEGDLSYEDGTYKFARLKAGEEVQITRPVQILPSASKTDKNAILIICVGTNDADKAEANYPPKLIQRIRRMIEYLDCKKFIVLGLTVEGKENVNPALEEEFGANFLDIHKYLINYGLSDNGLIATNEDLEDINNGLIPRQIRADSVHYNNNGYYSKAMGIYLKGKDLGYWK